MQVGFAGTLHIVPYEYGYYQAGSITRNYVRLLPNGPLTPLTVYGPYATDANCPEPGVYTYDVVWTLLHCTLDPTGATQVAAAINAPYYPSGTIIVVPQSEVDHMLFDTPNLKRILSVESSKATCARNTVLVAYTPLPTTGLPGFALSADFLSDATYTEMTFSDEGMTILLPA